MNTEYKEDDKIETFTGRFVDPLDLQISDLDIIDIAHSLSMQCRFTGHCKRHYSVAQHSILVASICPPEYQLWGLMHDAAETYLVDIPRPVKKNWQFKFYRDEETKAMRVILNWLGLEGEEPECVKHADNIVLATEARDLMTNSKSWGGLKGITPLPDPIVPWTPETTELVFLQVFRMLKK